MGSMKNESYRRSDRVYFYKLGLSNTAGRSSGNYWLMETLTGIKAMLKHQNVSRSVQSVDSTGHALLVLPHTF